MGGVQGEPADLLSKGTIEPTQFNVLKRQIMSGIGGADGSAPPAMATAPIKTVHAMARGGGWRCPRVHMHA